MAKLSDSVNLPKKQKIEEDKPGILTKAFQAFETPLAADVPVTDEERAKLRPGIADAVGALLATKAAPLLMASNPAGAILGILGVGLLGKQAKGRENLAESLEKRELARQQVEAERGIQSQKFGFDLARDIKTQRAAMDRVKEQIAADRRNLDADLAHRAEQGTLDRENQERIASLRTTGDRMLSIAELIQSIDSEILKASSKFPFDEQGARTATEGLTFLKSILLQEFMGFLKPGQTVAGVTAEEFQKIFNLTNAPNPTQKSESHMGVYNPETDEFE